MPGQAVDRDRVRVALHLADELPGEMGAAAKLLFGKPAFRAGLAEFLADTVHRVPLSGPSRGYLRFFGCTFFTLAQRARAAF